MTASSPKKYNYLELNRSEDQGSLIELTLVNELSPLEIWFKLDDSLKDVEDDIHICTLFLPISTPGLADPSPIVLEVLYQNGKCYTNPLGEINRIDTRFSIDTVKHEEGWQQITLFVPYSAQKDLIMIQDKTYLRLYGNLLKGHYNPVEEPFGWTDLGWRVYREKKEDSSTASQAQEAEPSGQRALLGLGTPYTSAQRFMGKIGRVRMWHPSAEKNKTDATFAHTHDMLPLNPYVQTIWTFDDEGTAYTNKIYHKYFEESEEDKAKAKSLPTTGNREKLESFLETVQDSLEQVRKSTQGSGYQLGQVQLQFRFVPEENGEYLYFPSPGEMEGITDRLSTMTVEFDATPPVKQVVSSSVKVPNLYGMTEVMARRELSGLGLEAVLNYEVTDDLKAVSRVIFQLPKAGEEVLPGNSVSLFIGTSLVV